MKEKDPETEIEEHESAETDVMTREGVQSFPTMKLKEGDDEAVLVGAQSSGDQIIKKLEKGLKKKKGGSRRKRLRTHRRSRKLFLRRTLRNYVGLR